MRSLVSIVLISMSALIFLGCGPSLTDEQVRQIEEATARAEQAAARAEKAETAASQAEREAEHRAREAERSALRPAPHD